MGQLIEGRFWASVVVELVSPPALPSPHYQDELSSIVLARSPFAAMSKGTGPVLLLSYSVASSSASTPPGPALLFCPGKVQGPISWVQKLVKGRDNSPALMALGPALLPASHFIFINKFMAFEGRKECQKKKKKLLCWWCMVMVWYWCRVVMVWYWFCVLTILIIYYALGIHLET